MHKVNKKQRKALRNMAKMPKPRKHGEHRRRISNILDREWCKPPKKIRWKFKW